MPYPLVPSTSPSISIDHAPPRKLLRSSTRLRLDVWMSVSLYPSFAWRFEQICSICSALGKLADLESSQVYTKGARDSVGPVFTAATQLSLVRCVVLRSVMMVARGRRPE